MIKLIPLSEDNWQACANLKVRPEQEEALPSNLSSMEELDLYPKTKAVAILNEEDLVVGFATFGIPKGERVSKIFRLMIDEKYQGRGYGKSALRQIVEELRASHDSNEIQVCYDPKRSDLKAFYGSVGFKEKGVVPCERNAEGKMLAILRVFSL